MLALTAAKPNARLPHARVTALYELSQKLGDGVVMSVHRSEPRSASLGEPLVRLPVGDDRTLIETLIACAQDECGALPKGTNYPIVFCVWNANGAEVARERIRFPGNVEVKTTTRPLDQEEADAAALEGDEHGKNWPSRMHPRESASVFGMMRQGMRHTEAMAGLLVKGHETTVKLNEQLGDRVEKLTTKVIAQADHVIEAQAQNRLSEAQARREDVETEAIRTTAALLAEYLPLGIHRITRKFGLAGDTEVDKLLEKLIEGFDPSQIDQLAGILKPAQKAVFAEMWQLVNGRREKRTKEADAKKKLSETSVDKMTGTKAEDTKPSGT